MALKIKKKEDGGNSIIKEKDGDKSNIPTVIGTPLENPIHEKFCQLYAQTLNATQAYLKSRQDSSGENTSSYDTARANGHKLLSKTDIRMRISEIQDKTAQSLDINRSEIIEGINNEINLDPADIYNWTGEALVLKNLTDIPLHVRQVIKKIKQNKDGEIEVTFYDRQKAREQLMKYLGMLSDKADININLDLGNRLAEAHARVLKRQGKPASPESEPIEAEFEEID